MYVLLSISNFKQTYLSFTSLPNGNSIVPKSNNLSSKKNVRGVELLISSLVDAALSNTTLGSKLKLGSSHMPLHSIWYLVDHPDNSIIKVCT